MEDSSKRVNRAGAGLFVVALLMGIFVATSAMAQAVQPVGGDAAASPLAQQDQQSLGLEVYGDTCARCHGAGGIGDIGVYPPFRGNPNVADPAHVEDVMLNGLKGAITVNGVIYDDSMSARGKDLSADEVAAVVAYVVGLSAQSPVTATGNGPTIDVDELPEGVPARGKQLFRGDASLTNGAAACAACHTAGSVGNFGGSSLGPDLTDIVDVFGTKADLQGWLVNTPAPTMDPIFSRHPLTPVEIADLSAFLEDAPSQDRPSYFGDALILGGIAGALVLFAGMAIAWRGMRQTYVEKLRSRQ